MLATACSSAAPAAGFQTGVQLQASFPLPETLEGRPTSYEAMDYLLYLPDGYGEDPAEQWPMIVFLHGAGDDDNNSGFVMSYGLPEVLHSGDQPEEFPFIVVSPQAFANVPWWTEDTLPVLNALIEDVKTTYQVDPTRVYVTGLSMGGYGTWYLAAAYPEQFAAAISISGSGFRTRYIPDPSIMCRLEDTPLWAIHGQRDLISGYEASKLFVDALEVQCDPAEVNWTLYPDTGHFETYERAYRDPELYDWLLAHRRQASAE